MEKDEQREKVTEEKSRKREIDWYKRKTKDAKTKGRERLKRVRRGLTRQTNDDNLGRRGKQGTMVSITQKKKRKKKKGKLEISAKGLFGTRSEGRMDTDKKKTIWDGCVWEASR